MLSFSLRPVKPSAFHVMAFLFRILARLPLPMLHNLGALLGWLAYAASPTYRRHLRENTELAGDWRLMAVSTAQDL